MRGRTEAGQVAAAEVLVRMEACAGVIAVPFLGKAETLEGVDLSLEVDHPAGSAALKLVFALEGAEELSVFDPQLGREVVLDDLSEMTRCFGRSSAYLAALGHSTGQLDPPGQQEAARPRFTVGLWVFVAVVFAAAMIVGRLSRCLF